MESSHIAFSGKLVQLSGKVSFHVTKTLSFALTLQDICPKEMQKSTERLWWWLHCIFRKSI
jgi:hypothetical protein